MRKDATVLHLDADAFFAAVEQRQKPSLRGKPVVVGSLGPRGVVATASYEARPFGVHSAQPMAQARSGCPQATFLAPRFAAYSAHSAQIMAVLRRLSDRVDAVGMDEAYVDLAGGRFADDPAGAGRWARAAVYRRTGLSVSVGFGRSKLVAKLASEAGKPHGLTVIGPEQEDEFLLSHPVGALSGVGPVTRDLLARYGISTIADLRRLTERALIRTIGAAAGRSLYLQARGIDERPVVGDRRAKSVSNERTFDVDLRPHQLPDALEKVLVGTLARLRGAHRAAQTVTVKIRRSDFVTLTRAVTIEQPSADPDVLGDAARRALTAAGVSWPVRLLGVGFSALADYEQLTLTAVDPHDTTLGATDDDEQCDAETVEVAAPAALTTENCRAGMDVGHPIFGRGWVTGRVGKWIRVRFEGPDTYPASHDRTFDARLGVLYVTPPAEPAGRVRHG